MINKEEIESVNRLNRQMIIERTAKNLGMRVYISDIQKTIDVIKKQENRIKELEEQNAEHQKLNGELQKRITELEEICKGKSIQELGVSKLYESNELREQIEKAKKRGWKDITVDIDIIDRILSNKGGN